MHEMTFASIEECNIDIKLDMYSNVILSGGNTLLKGLPDRLEKELDALCPYPGRVKIIATSDRLFSAWQGGSTYSSMSTFESQWITKEEYDENGAEIVHRKCVC
jgi:actin-related protein